MCSQNSSAGKENCEKLVQMNHYTNDMAFSYLFYMYLITYNAFTLLYDCTICTYELDLK